MGAQLTDHARARMHQRGISAEALDALLEFGREQHVAPDMDIVFRDKKAEKRLVKADIDLAWKPDKLFKTYAALGRNGAVVTMGHRYRSVHKP